MSAPKLTIGIPVFDDFARLHVMIQAIRTTHADALPDCELVIVDNNPNSKDGIQTREFCDRINVGPEQFAWARSEDGKAGGSFSDAERWAFGHGVVYHPMKEIAGTAPAKQRIFEIARGDAVLVMDAHIIPFPGTLRRLIDFYRDNPETIDLYQGAYALDTLVSGYGSMRAGWGGTMHGKWQIDARSHDLDDPPFEIWGHGMGFFSCRRLAWVGFNPRFRGFGGEEGYIHEKFRQAGAKCWSLPWLRMWHSYGMRDDQRTNPMDQESTLWNNIVGHLEVGWDLAEMKEQYLSGNPATKSPKISAELWDKTLAAALADAEPPRMGYWKSLDEAFQASATKSPDFAAHVPTLKALAQQCQSAVELTHHGHGTVGILAGLADRDGTSLTTIHESPCGETDRLVDVAGKCNFRKEVGKWTGRSIPKCDLLFIDTRHNAGQLSQELMEHAPNVAKFIVMHDTDIFGEKGDNGGPGLNAAIRGYLAWSGARWHLHSVTKETYGLTVLARTSAVPAPNPLPTLTPGPGQLAKPSNGAGTILMKMFEAMGVEKKADCDCQGTANNMDLWGVAGCRGRYNQIVGTLKDGQYRWGWAEKIKAGMNAATKLGLVLNPLDPFPQLLDRALADAEKWEATL